MSIILSNNLKYTSSQRFGSSQKTETRRFTDEEVLDYAKLGPDFRLKGVAKNMVGTLALIPVIDTFATFVSKNGSLVKKSKAAAVTGMLWGVAGTTAFAVNKTKKFINNHSLFMNDFHKDHPVLSLFIDLAAIYAGIRGAFTIAEKSYNVLNKNFSKQLSNFNDKFVKPMLKSADKSAINEKVILPFERFKALNPNFAKSLKVIGALAVPTIIVASTVRYCKEINHRNQAVASNYHFLKSVNDSLPVAESDDVKK